MIHIFDVDNTLIRKTSTWYFLREALSKGIIRLSQIRHLPLDWIKYKLGNLDVNFIEDAVRPFIGIKRKALEQIAQNCFESRIKPNIYTDAVKLIREILNRREKVIFATSSLKTIIEPLERFFGIEGSIASMLEFHDETTTGKILGDSSFGLKKKTQVEAWLGRNGLSPKELCFYSDSYTDLPLLEYSGFPVAVNPDRILRKKAEKRGWQIVRFMKTIGKSNLPGKAPHNKL